MLRDPITSLPQWYTKKFWNLVASSGSDRSVVQAANLTLRYDLANTVSGPPAENRYICDVVIVDDRGMHFRADFSGWKYVEKKGYHFVDWDASNASVWCWWNPMTWFRR